MPSDPCLDIEHAVLEMLDANKAMMSSTYAVPKDVPYDLFLGNDTETPAGDARDWSKARPTADWSQWFKTKQEYEEWLWQAVRTNFEGYEYPWYWVHKKSCLVVPSESKKAYLIMIKREDSNRPCAAILWTERNLLEFWDTKPITDGRFLPVADCIKREFTGPLPRIANSAPYINVMKPEDPDECRMWCLYWALLRICLGCTPGAINEWYLSKTQEQRWTVIDTFRKLYNSQPGTMDPKMLLHIPNMAPCKEEFKLGKRLANPDVSVEVPQDKRLKLTYDLWERRIAKKKKLDHPGSKQGCLLVHKGAIKFLSDFANVGESRHDIFVVFRGEVLHPSDEKGQWIAIPNIKSGVTNQDWMGLMRNLQSHAIFRIAERYRFYHGNNVFKIAWSKSKPTLINLTTKEHASGAIYWPGDNVLEIWNTMPITDTAFVVLAKLIKEKLKLSKFPEVIDGGATFFMQGRRPNVSVEKPEDTDEMCQTWIWYWAFMRIAFGCPPAKFKKWIESTPVAARADLMMRFFSILASVGQHGGRIKNVDELSKYMDTSMCQTAKPRSSNGFYAPPARPMVDDEEND
jgi:hypothetical protein